MRILILDGSSSDDGTAKNAIDLISKVEGEEHDIEVLTLEEMDVKGCLGCFGCWIRTPGICVIDDDARMIAEKMMGCDLMVWVTPITFGGYSYHLKKVIDRLIPNIHPCFVKIDGEIHHARRYERYPRLFVVGTVEERDEEMEALFRLLVSRNAINMYSPSFFVSIVSGKEGIRDQIDDSLRGMGVLL